MKLILFFQVIVFVGIQASAALDFKQHLVAGCRVYTGKGELLKQYAGNFCLFLPDGRYISADSTRIAMYRNDKSEAWKILGHFHHQLNWADDKKYILAMSSDFFKTKGVTTRIDVLRKIDLSGKIVAEISAQAIYEQLKIQPTFTPFNWDPAAPKAKFEMSHFNSFYEIPKLRKKSKFTGLQAGNFVANSLVSGAVILDFELKVALNKVTFPTSKNQMTHDVQVTEDGDILFFNNERVRDSDLGPRSSVEIMNPSNRKVVYSFMASPPEMFYSVACGGVQILDRDHLLISHVMGEFFYLNRKTKKVAYADMLSTNRQPSATPYTQDIHASDLSEFLKKW